MKRLILLSALLLLAGGVALRAQSALEQMTQMAGYTNLNVPPPSEPVCAYCRIPLRGAHDWDHQSWCEYYHPRPGTQTQQSSRVEDPYADERGNYSRVTYPQQQVEVYIPPTPIRDTPEGQAILQATEQLSYAVTSLLMDGLRDMISAGFDRIYESTHREYHSSDPEKGWGNLQIVSEKGKEGAWNNITHKWYVKPGKFDKFLVCDPYNCAVQKNGKWGLVDVTEKARELVPCQFDEVLFYTRYGVGSPIAFGVRDQGGNMHWMIGRTVLKDGKYQFVPYEGEWSSVNLSFKPIPGKDDKMVAIVAKDAKTGRDKVLNYSGRILFGRRAEEQYQNIFLTGMVEAKTYSSGGATSWYDFYRVENDGKTGFVLSEYTADYKTHLMSYEMMPCEYDEITPMANTIGWKDAQRWGSKDFKGKELVVVQKNGRFDAGRTSHFRGEKELPYVEIMVMRIPFHGNEKLPVVIGVEPDGRYVAQFPDGMPLVGWKTVGYNAEGKRMVEYTGVKGYDLSEVMEDVKAHLRAEPKQWHLTDEEIRLLQ